MKVAIYARVSTTDKGQDVDLQLTDLRRMAETRGFEITEEFVDRGWSGSKDRRPDLDRLMADARKGCFRAILVWKLDRFARSLRHLVNALDELRGYGVDFVSYQDPIDTSTPAGRMLFQILGSFAEFERELLRERVRAGLANARRKGKKLGRPKAHLDVEKARKLRGEGLSFKKVAERLGASVGSVHAALN